MKKELFNFRIWAVVLLTTIAIMGIIAMPESGSGIAKWLTLFAVSKIVGVLALMLAASLFQRWNCQGKMGILGKITKEED